MAKKEFTKHELIDLLSKLSIDGKVSFNDLGEIIFDSRFPDELFENAKNEIIKARDDEKRFKIIAGLFHNKAIKALELQKEVVRLSYDKIQNFESIRSLKEQITAIEAEIKPIEKEFLEIKARIDERKGE